MIQINENTKITADDAGYAVSFRSKTSKKGIEGAIKLGKTPSEYTWSSDKYSSTFHGILKICLENAINNLAQSKDIYTLKEVIFKIEQTKQELLKNYTLNELK